MTTNSKHALRPFLKNEHFHTEGNIVIFDSKQAISGSTPLHKQAKSTFDYKDHYQKDADFFDYFKEYPDGATRHENRRLHETILSELNAKDKIILDIGCGNAWVAQALTPLSQYVISLDISSTNVRKAQEAYPHPKHLGIVADLYHLPFKENSIDGIICAEVMEHVSNPKLLVEKLLYCLKPNGVLIITTPYNEKIKYSLCVHCNCPTPLHAHLHSFTEANVKTEILAKINPTTIKNAQLYTFSNNYLTKLRTHLLLKYLPFRWWRRIDQFTNFIARKPLRLLMKLQKAQN